MQNVDTAKRIKKIPSTFFFYLLSLGMDKKEGASHGNRGPCTDY